MPRAWRLFVCWEQIVDEKTAEIETAEKNHKEKVDKLQKELVLPPSLPPSATRAFPVPAPLLPSSLGFYTTRHTPHAARRMPHATHHTPHATTPHVPLMPYVPDMLVGLHHAATRT